MRYQEESSSAAANSGMSGRVADRRRIGAGGIVRGGFTIVELLIVIAIIVVLVSIGTVTAGKMRSASEVTATKHLMSTIRNGLTQFYQDFNYYPPLLGDDEGNTNTFLMPVEDSEDKEKLGFYSTLTLAPYLVGIGDLDESHPGNPEDPSHVAESMKDWHDDGQPGVGFRDPGSDRSWGYTHPNQQPDTGNRTDYFDDLESSYVITPPDPENPISGKVYGPYIELSDESQLAQAVFMDREWDLEDPLEEYESLVLFEIRDYWDRPIRYYRDWSEHPHAERAMEEFNQELYPAEWSGAFEQADGEGLDAALRSAPYVLFSMGPDRKATSVCTTIAAYQTARTADINKDNIVEIGN